MTDDSAEPAGGPDFVDFSLHNTTMCLEITKLFSCPPTLPVTTAMEGGSAGFAGAPSRPTAMDGGSAGFAGAPGRPTAMEGGSAGFAGATTRPTAMIRNCIPVALRTTRRPTLGSGLLFPRNMLS